MKMINNENVRLFIIIYKIIITAHNNWSLRLISRIVIIAIIRRF